MPKLLQSKSELAGELLCALGRPVVVGGLLLPPITPGALSLLDAFGSPLVHPSGPSGPNMDELVASLLVWLEGPRAIHWRGYIPLLTLCRHLRRMRQWKRRGAAVLWAVAREHIQASLAPLRMIHSAKHSVKTIDLTPEGQPTFGVDWLRSLTAATLRAGFAATFQQAAWHTPLLLACHAAAAEAVHNGCRFERPLDAAASRATLAKYAADNAASLAAIRAKLTEQQRHG